MTRGFGEVAFAEQLPDVVTLAFGIVTQLGDIWFLTVGALALYWFGRRDSTITLDARRDSAHMVALLLSAYTLTLVLKTVFALPRPPGAADATAPAWLPAVIGPAYESFVTGHGFGFPSGHALTTTVVYGGLARTLTVWDAPRRARVAAGIVALVSLSRVVIGVHYVVDVVAGFAIGIVFLWAIDRYANGNPVQSFVPAVAFGLIAFPLTGSYKAVGVATIAATGIVACRASASNPRDVRSEVR